MARVTVIPPTINPLTHLPTANTRRRRVAGYARVSTDSEEQQTSYTAQVDYYTHYIQSKPEWEFIAVYTDEGISALNTKHRDGFNQMVDDALAGKIDLIVTKSVSRFARNTVDSLTTVRKLKENGIEVYFEKENIFTLDSKGELLITIMSSLAQEESRSISENVTWGQRKRFADGKVSMAYSRFLGYEKGETKDDPPVINEQEAATVRLIYALFLEGKTAAGIGKYLESLGILSPGGSTKWSKTTIDSILTNEKYKGDALLQKRFTVDFLQKKLKPNQGEVPQYYVEGSHPAIVEPDEWDHVQSEFARRKQLGKAYSGKSVLSTKLVCADCGGYYGRKLWHSTDKYRSTIWQCNAKFEHKCTTPVLTTETIQLLFITAYNRVMDNLPQVVADCELMRKSLTDFASLDAKIASQEDEATVIAEMAKAAVAENASTTQSQEEYLKKYESLTQRYEETVAVLERLKAERTLREQQDKAMGLFIRTLRKQPQILTEWNDTIWTVMVEKGVVYPDGHIKFVFYNGTEIEVGAD